jgi:ABC-type nitrate/sulfonate/bicarbonate transport system ATPase subunit
MISIQDGIVSLSGDGKRNLTVNFSLSEGDVAVLIGPNGSGKSTVLDILAGVRKLDKGKFRNAFNSHPIGYAVQDSYGGLLPWLSLYSNIILPAEIQRMATKELHDKIMALLESFGLESRTGDYPYRLSGGEKQMVNVIRAVCTPATFFLLDEPFAHLHSSAHNKAKDAIRAVLVNKTVVIVTHEPEDFDLRCNRFFSIMDSTIVEITKDKAEELLSHAT